MEQLQQYASVLPETGDMSFPDYIAALRAAGLRDQNWLKAKHAGVIVATLDENARVRISRPAAAPEGGA